MKRKKIKKQLNYQPSGLTVDHIENPAKFMSYFFAAFPLSETRNNIWELYKGWVHYSSENMNAKESIDMICFYNHFIEFINASYVYVKAKKEFEVINKKL